MIRAAAITLLLLLIPALPAAAQNLLPGFTGFTIDEPPDPPPPGGVQHYGATGANPAWVVAQWNIPGGKLSPFAPMPGGGFIASAAEATVQVRPTGEVLLSQTGAVLPCDIKQGDPRESDLFLSPAQDFKPKAISLGGLAALRVSGKISVEEGFLPGRVCSANQGSSLISVIVADHAVQPAQFIFYQLSLSNLCQPGPGGFPCGKHHKVSFYGKANPFGMDDFLPLAGQSFLTGGTPASVNIDLLPRLKNALDEGPASMDKDLSHWTLDSIYIGQHIWGGVTMRSSWSGLQLTAEPQD